MVKYTAQFLSYHAYSEEVIYEILDCNTVKEIVFPASASQPEPTNSVDVASVDEVKDANLWEHFTHSDLTYFSLNSKSGAKFSSTLYPNEGATPNALVLKFSSSYSSVEELTLDLIRSLFLDIIAIFKPHYAALYDSTAISRLNQLGKLKNYTAEGGEKYYPLHVQWITYFGPEMLNFLGAERFQRLETCVEKCEFCHGILVILQKDNYNDENFEHRRRQEQAESELGFPDLLSSQ